MEIVGAIVIVALFVALAIEHNKRTELQGKCRDLEQFVTQLGRDPRDASAWRHDGDAPRMVTGAINGRFDG